MHAASLYVKWHPNSEEDLRGYKIYYGTTSGNYKAPVNVGNLTAYTLDDLSLREGII